MVGVYVDVDVYADIKVDVDVMAHLVAFTFSPICVNDWNRSQTTVVRPVYHSTDLLHLLEWQDRQAKVLL